MPKFRKISYINSHDITKLSAGEAAFKFNEIYEVDTPQKNTLTCQTKDLFLDLKVLYKLCIFDGAMQFFTGTSVSSS